MSGFRRALGRTVARIGVMIMLKGTARDQMLDLFEIWSGPIIEISDRG